MKKRDLERQLKDLGWHILRQQGGHDVWSNGAQCQPVPRHREINEYTAKSIIAFAKKNPPKKD